MTGNAMKCRLNRERRTKGIRVARVPYEEDRLPARLVQDGFLRAGSEENANAVGAAIERMLAAYAEAAEEDGIQ
jgi:hypothetical protein